MVRRLKNNEFTSGKGGIAFWLTFPAIFLIIIIIGYPLLFSISSSLKNTTGNISWINYQAVLADKYFWLSLKNTALFTIIIVSLEIVIGFSIALCLQQLKFKLRDFFRALFIFPLLMSSVIAAYEWMWLFNDQYGLINQVLLRLSIKPPLWLVNSSWAFFSICVVDIWVATPFVILVFQSALASLPKETYEQASLEGANAIQKFLYLTLPYMKNPIFVVLIIRTMDVFRIYDSIAVLTGGGPGVSTTSLSLFAFRTGISFGKLNQSAAISLLMIFPMLLITAIYIRFMFRIQE